MKRSLDIVFMGTPEFAVASLRAIHKSHHKVKAVITSVDKPAGRGNKLRQSAIKKYALDNDIQILQPKNLKCDEFNKDLRKLQADLFVVVAFRMLPEKVWSIPPLGTINLHGSLLPDYRGAAPINWAVMNGDKQTGVTTFYINEKIDTGEVLLQARMKISETDTAGDVHDTMMILGAKTLLNTLEGIGDDKLNSSPQNWNTTYRKAPKIHKKDCLIDWNKDNLTIYNMIRGLSPYPTAYTVLGNKVDGSTKNLKIFFGELEQHHNDENLNPGDVTFEASEKFSIKCGNGSISVTELQLEGKKRMKTADFMRGFQNEFPWKIKM